MKVLILDIETTVQWVEDLDEETGKVTTVIDNSPFNPANRIVSVHWRRLEIPDGASDYDSIYERLGSAEHSIYYHKEQTICDPRQDLQDALDWADIFVAHNAKYDYMYLQEAGFILPDKVYCTMIGEYILARGVEMPFSLEETAKRRNLGQEKLDITKEYFKQHIGYESIPLVTVIEYGNADTLACAQIFIKQYCEYKDEKNLTLNNIVELMNEMLLFIVHIERNGIKIDRQELAKIESEFRLEHAQLEKDLNKLAASVMEDEPFSLTSPLDISKIVYSREVVDSERHKSVFNLGTDFYGKKKYPPYMTDTQFRSAVRLTTKVIKKKSAAHCIKCNGYGKIRKIKKDGSDYKKESVCSVCSGRGFTLHETSNVAGFKLVPERPSDASMHGFSVSKLEMPRLIAQAQQKGNLAAVEFLTKKKRLNAINTYLNSFVEGIQRWTREDGLLHAGFNQAIAKTGRLSSSKPNFQNQPKEKKFPIRRCVISRFENGVITECDFSGLEFVVAGELSRDPQIIEDILTGKDIHRQTASIVKQKPKEDVTKDERNELKPYTFAPLYGGQGANEPAHIQKYFHEFFNIYVRHGKWQREQMEAVIKNGFIRTPSGREYRFPGTRRLKGGRTTNSTAIVNYPVQGFATGDIVPLACIRAYREFMRLKLRSRLILTVHDSIVVDTHPDEKKEVVEILKWATTGCPEEIKEKWKYEMVLPLKSEVSQGNNWMNMETMH
jgi:DNA polymerase I-like protein with 3'-5' exonuclease and polymerase domains